MITEDINLVRGLGKSSDKSDPWWPKANTCSVYKAYSMTVLSSASFEQL